MTRRLEFDAAHRVPLHGGKCRALHGHRYVAEVTCIADALTEEGFVIDFGIVKEVLGGWIDAKLDHTTILEEGDPVGKSIEKHQKEAGREVFYMDAAPTAENIARLIFNMACVLISGDTFRIHRVRVWETPNCYADYPAPVVVAPRYRKPPA